MEPRSCHKGKLVSKRGSLEVLSSNPFSCFDQPHLVFNVSMPTIENSGAQMLPFKGSSYLGLPGAEETKLETSNRRRPGLYAVRDDKEQNSPIVAQNAPPPPPKTAFPDASHLPQPPATTAAPATPVAGSQPTEVHSPVADPAPPVPDAAAQPAVVPAAATVSPPAATPPPPTIPQPATATSPVQPGSAPQPAIEFPDARYLPHPSTSTQQKEIMQTMTGIYICLFICFCVIVMAIIILLVTTLPLDHL